MATIDIRKVHGTTIDDAATKMRAMLERFAAKRAELVKDVAWDPSGQRAKVTGKGFKGTFTVDASTVTIAVDLSFVARPFKGRIQDELTRRLDNTFAS